MNISPLSFQKINHVTFWANNPSSLVDNSHKSLQNNGPEIKIPPEVYRGAIIGHTSE